MATLYSDIYIDGENCEVFAIDGAQIKEVWLNGECIWKLTDRFEKAVHALIWARYQDEYYGFGIYPLDDKPPYLSNRWGRVYFRGDDAQDLGINYVTVGNGVNDLFNSNFSANTPVSVYDFGLCIFPSQAYNVNTVTSPHISVLPGHEIDSTEASQGVQLCDVLGAEFVNISDPMGVYCNVFNGRYQIRGSDNSRTVEIYDMLNNATTYVSSTDINCAGCATGMCAYTAGKIFFVPRTNSVQGLYTKKNLPLYYLEENDLNTLKVMEIDISGYLEPDLDSENGYSLLYVGGSSIDADDGKVVFGLTLTLNAIGDTGKKSLRHIIVKYEKGLVTSSETVIPVENTTSPSLLGDGIRIVGKYIVICSYGRFFVAGTTIDNMQRFQGYNGRPHVFYEENDELYYDEIYTYEWTSNQKPVPSVIIKNKVNFADGTTETVSETEINGRLED